MEHCYTHSARIFVESFTDVLCSYVRFIQPDVGWTLAYMVFFSWMYLFHAPFRVHSGHLDWYSHLTKMLQTWFGAVVLFFHASPNFFQSKREEVLNLSSGSSGAETVAAVFFPTFSISTLMIMYAHKKRSEWGLVITYGSTGTVVLLNAMLLSLFSTMHYGYCMQLQAKDWPTWLSSAVDFVCPEPQKQAPILLHVQLTVINVLFMAFDYQYKKMRGYDPLRGLLWSDVLNLRLEYNNTKYTTVSRGDWRMLQPQPHGVTRNRIPKGERGSISNSILPYQQNVGRSFSLSEEELKEVVTVEHPLNRPGMVTWLSTFIAGTALQVALGSLLNFLTFDQRTTERFVKPKIFYLNFVDKIDSLPSCCSSECSFALSVSLQRNSCVGNTPASDVWFDFIGDVGDGFNSTYEMARLMAQPSLTLRNTTAKNSRWVKWNSMYFNHKEENTLRSPLTPLTRSQSSTPMKSVCGTNSFSLEDYDLKELYYLPRGSFVIIGGDLAYPNPTDENYQTRLREPYNDALRECRQLRELMQEQYKKVIVQDTDDEDVAKITMISSPRVDAIVNRRGLAQKRSDEECIRSVPLLFSIPGNHDWLDGLKTFRRYIIEESWLGGWFMPQSSSFFVLALPYNWFVFACDTGSIRDIDCGQRNYFLRVINDRLNDDSCVILTCHEPSWIFEELETRRETPMQPQLNKVIDAIGTRLRLRLCGDIHNYSRHTPANPLSEAPTLVVSGGGGAFLHGARTAPIISQGTPYVRAAAFPRRNETITMLTRLVGFRIINWKFDIIIGFLCFGLIFSALPLAMEGESMEDVADVSQFAANVVSLTLELCIFTFNKAFVSFFVAMFFFAVFFFASYDKKNIGFRFFYALYWTGLVVLTSTATLAFAHITLVYMANKRLLLSGRDHWESMIVLQVRKATDTFMNHTREMLGEGHVLSKGMKQVELITVKYGFKSLVCYALRAADVVENLAYLSQHVSSNVTGTFSESTDRLHMFLYIIHLLLLYWLLATPLLSFVIGFYLFVSVHFFDIMYDAAYSSFQIEDYKHFVRFCIKAETRELHGYVVAEQYVPKTWESDETHVRELKHPEKKHLPPHLRTKPSRWKPIQSPGLDSEAIVLEHFVVKPHRLNVSPDCETPLVSTPSLYTSGRVGGKDKKQERRKDDDVQQEKKANSGIKPVGR